MNELLEEVLGSAGVRFDVIDDDKVWFTRRGDTMSSHVSAYKLQSMCKVWAFKKGHTISSYIDADGGHAYCSAIPEHYLARHETEYESVYSLCEKLIS